MRDKTYKINFFLEDGRTQSVEFAVPSGEDGKDGKDGVDGYTPQKGVDYFDGKDGKDGVDGKDGKNGTDATVTAANIKNALGYTPANEQTVSRLSGEIDKLNKDSDSIASTQNKAVIDTLGKNTFGVSLKDGFYIGVDGNLTQMNSYYTYIYQIPKSGYLYFDETVTNSAVLMFAVYNDYPSANTWCGTRYRLSDGNLPNESNKLAVTEGQYIAVSVYLNVTVSDLYWTLYHEYTEEVRVEKNLKIQMKYVNGNGADDSTEKVEVYVPTGVGFVRYDFLHCISEEKNADVWRIGYAYAVDDSFNVRYPLTVCGEWECALHLNNSGDYSGGIVHGNELMNDIVFFVDGGKVDIRNYTELTPIKYLAIAQASKMYDSTDSSTMIATHGREHYFDNDGLKISQTLKWEHDANLTWCYMAMNLPQKTYTDKFYTDVSIIPSDITYGVNENAKKTILYGEESGVRNEFSIEEYPTGLTGGDSLLITDNGGNPYNKCYYVICSSANVTEGTTWKTISKYRFDVNK